MTSLPCFRATSRERSLLIPYSLVMIFALSKVVERCYYNYPSLVRFGCVMSRVTCLVCHSRATVQKPGHDPRPTRLLLALPVALRTTSNIQMSQSDPSPHPVVDSTAVFKADIFKNKVLFCTGGGSGICRIMTEAVVRWMR